MKWIKCSESLPDDYDARYVVACISACEKCDLLERGIYTEDHWHKLNFRRYHFSTAKWSRANPQIAEWYQAKNDNSWDWTMNDGFCEAGLTDKEITHWLKLPKLSSQE